MSRFLPYSPEQAYLIPPSVQDELGADHLCFFVRQVVSRLELSRFEQAYSLEGGELYAPELMLSVWLYAYAVGLTSARRLEQRLEQRLVEDLALRYLAGGARVDNWALSGFRRRHAGAINDAFTQVLEMARQLGWGKLGRVAIDATRRKAVVEAVFGVLKQQRGMRQFRTRGLGKAGCEFGLAALAYNVTRLHALRQA